MIRRTDLREKPCLPSLAVEILYSELQAAPSMLIEFPFVGRRPSLDGGLSELCDAAAEVTRGAPVRVMDCVGSAVIGRLCAGSEVEAKTVVVMVGGCDVVPAGSGPRLTQWMPCSAARRDRY